MSITVRLSPESLQALAAITALPIERDPETGRMTLPHPDRTYVAEPETRDAA